MRQNKSRQDRPTGPTDFTDNAIHNASFGSSRLNDQITKTVLQYLACEGKNSDGTPISNLRIIPFSADELSYDPHWMPYAFQTALRSQNNTPPIIESVRRLTFAFADIDFIAVLHDSLRQVPNLEEIHFENFTDSLTEIMSALPNGRRRYPDITIVADALFLRGIPLTFRSREDGAINYLQG